MQTPQSSNCSLLASTLSANYLNTEPYKNSDGQVDGINTYLLSHGILLSMCLDQTDGGACIIPTDSEFQHVAASWFNAELGARRHFFPTMHNIGMILDPSVARLECVYPANAGTDRRDNDGCGPRKEDRKYGSAGYDRMSESGREKQRQYWKRFQELNYYGASWEDIPCDQFFQYGISRAICFRRNETATTSCHDFKRNFVEGKFVTASAAEDVLYDLGPFFHEPTPPCNKNKISTRTRSCAPSFPTDVSWWLYTGECVWDAETEWQDMVDAFLELCGMHHDDDNSTLIWNEIVLELPQHLQDIIQAIFYIVDDDNTSEHVQEQRKLAHLEAKLKGNKPVLVMNLSADVTGKVPLFECDKVENFVAYN